MMLSPYSCQGWRAMQEFSTTVALSSLVVTLGACLIYVLKYVITRAMPAVMDLQTVQLEKVCATFRETSEQDRNLVITLHREIVGELVHLTTAVESMQQALRENQDALSEVLLQCKANGGRGKLRVYCP